MPFIRIRHLAPSGDRGRKAKGLSASETLKPFIHKLPSRSCSVSASYDRPSDCTAISVYLVRRPGGPPLHIGGFLEALFGALRALILQVNSQPIAAVMVLLLLYQTTQLLLALKQCLPWKRRR